ncbi:MAG: hypothetical protein ACOX5Q_02210 [Bacillota bacterium]
MRYVRMPFRLRRLIAAFCLVALTATLSCLTRAEGPEKYDLQGVRLVVWDSLQAKFPGHSDYSEEVSRVISAFCLETGVTVDLHYAERREVLELLSDPGPRQEPHLVFSGEWPVISGNLQDIRGDVDPELFIDAAQAYWMRDDRLFGIPAFIQWTGTAVKGAGALDETGAGDDPDTELPPPEPARTGYWVDSPAFLRCALDAPGASWDAERVIEYVEWAKDSFGLYTADPLLSWQTGEVDALYPVNPYLYKWLKVSQSGDVSVKIVPPETPFGDSRFHYTVPAYVVLCEEAREKAAAAQLGRRLAASLGRWAARTLGCIPALIDDMPIFNLESDFTYAERRRLWDSVSQGKSVAPDISEYLETSSLAGALVDPLEMFLSGKSTAGDLKELIHGAFSRHTRP